MAPARTEPKVAPARTRQKGARMTQRAPANVGGGSLRYYVMMNNIASSLDGRLLLYLTEDIDTVGEGDERRMVSGVEVATIGVIDLKG